MRYSLVLVLLISLPCLSQTATTGQAITNQPCSIANTGTGNKIHINCGIGKEQGQKMLAILNKILVDRLDPREVMSALNQLHAEVSYLSSLIPVTTGELLPADQPDPPNICKDPIPDNALKVFLGAAVLYTQGTSVDAVVVGAEPVVSLERSSNGTLLINATVRSPDGRIIAQVVSGKFFINPNNYYRAESDKSTLTVYDQQGHIALKVRYLNPLSVLVMGNFIGKTGSVAVNEKEIVLNGAIHIEGGCISRPKPGATGITIR